MDETGCSLNRIVDKIGRLLDFAGKEERILKLRWTGAEDDTTRMDRVKHDSIKLWSFPFEIDAAELKFHETYCIGKYEFGQIKLANWRGTVVSARIVERKMACSPRICLLSRWYNRPACQLIRQLSLLHFCRHPNIVQFLGAVPNYNGKSLVLVTEYLPNGNLHELLHSKKFRIQQKDAVAYALDIARGMNYLHHHRPAPVVHGELNPMNLLIDDAGHLKVAGIGLSKLIGCIWSEDGSDYAAIQNLMYSHIDNSFDFSRYLAPEFQRCKGNVETSADVYSFGIIFQEMLEGPNFSSRHAKVVAANRSGTGSGTDMSVVKTNLPPRLREVLAGCCDLDPKNRPQFHDIICSLEEIYETMMKKSFLRSFVTSFPFRQKSLRTAFKNQPGSSDNPQVNPLRPHQSSPEESIPPRADEAEAKNGLPTKNAEEKLVGQCVVCWDAPAEAACVPCGHLSGCMNCLTDIKSTEGGCPVCRATIQQVVKVYVV